MANISDGLRGAAQLAGLLFRAARLPAPPALTLEQRLKNLPLDGAPVRAPVTIRWDQHALPIISALNMPDLAVGVGVVHAHLRLGQMEIMRRLAVGRIAEMIGPFGLRFDIALRCLDLGRAVPEMIAMLPEESRLWAEGFLAGVNFCAARAEKRPLDCAVLGITREPWTMHDLMGLARLASADICWSPAVKLLKRREKMPAGAWRALWPELAAAGLPAPSGPAAALSRGSNSMAVGGARAAGGAAMIASDPHVGLQLPSIWLAASLEAPGFCASGLMIPGLPTVAIGRNADIAWGATNLHAGSSVLVDLAAEADPGFSARRVEIAVRGGPARAVTLRDSRFGPVISDCALFGLKRPTALSWVGHRASDELTAMLAVNRAKDFAGFRDALKGYAVQGYSFTFADRAGRTGIVRAAHVPARTAPPRDLVEPASVMARVVSLAETDFVFDPPEGFVVSANEDPGGDIHAGFFYAPPDRAARLTELAGRTGLTRADMAAAQADTFSRGSLAGRDRLAARARALGVKLPAALLEWDGDYAENAAGALAYEILIGEAARRVIPKAELTPLLTGWTGRGPILRRLLAAGDATLRPALAAAARAAAGGQNWGAAHQLTLAHPLGRLPWAGRVFGRFSFGVPGANDTVYKMGHKSVRAARGGRHGVTYGASARHIADFADPYINFVVILGGQDGWIGAVNATDQIKVFRQGELLQLPVTSAHCGAAFSWVTTLNPPQ